MFTNCCALSTISSTRSAPNRERHVHHLRQGFCPPPAVSNLSVQPERQRTGVEPTVGSTGGPAISALGRHPGADRSRTATRRARPTPNGLSARGTRPLSEPEDAQSFLGNALNPPGSSPVLATAQHSSALFSTEHWFPRSANRSRTDH